MMQKLPLFLLLLLATATAGLSAQQRASYVNFANRSDYFIEGTDEMEVTIGMEMPMTIEYHTMITDAGVEQQLVQVAVRIRERDAAGNRINANESAFVAPITAAGGGENSDTTTVTFTVPEQTVSMMAIMLSRDLPAGHYHTFDIILVEEAVGGGRNFTEDQGRVQIVTELGTSGGGGGGNMLEVRDRFVQLLNQGDFIEPGDGDVLTLLPDQMVNFNLAYATAVEDLGGTLTEEDLIGLNVRISRLDASGNTIAQNQFAGGQLVFNSGPNTDTVTVPYTVVTTLADGSSFPLSADLPAGESYLLRFILITQSPGEANEFLEATYPLQLGPAGNGGGGPEDRAEFVSWDNADAFVPAGDSLPNFMIGQTVNMTISYATEVTGGVEADLDYVAVELQQLDETGNIVQRGTFNVVVGDDAPNTGTVDYAFTVPATYSDNTTLVPNTSMLPAGHSLRLAVFAQTDLGEVLRYPNDNRFITIGMLTSTEDDAALARELRGVFPNPTAGDLTLTTSGALRGMDVQLLDLTGRILLRQRYDQLPARVTLPTAQLPTGSYLLRLSDGRGQVSRMFVKR